MAGPVVASTEYCLAAVNARKKKSQGWRLPVDFSRLVRGLEGVVVPKLAPTAFRLTEEERLAIQHMRNYVVAIANWFGTPDATDEERAMWQAMDEARDALSVDDLVILKRLCEEEELDA